MRIATHHIYARTSCGTLTRLQGRAGQGRATASVPSAQPMPSDELSKRQRDMGYAGPSEQPSTPQRATSAQHKGRAATGAAAAAAGSAAGAVNARSTSQPHLCKNCQVFVRDRGPRDSSCEFCRTWLAPVRSRIQHLVVEEQRRGSILHFIRVKTQALLRVLPSEAARKAQVQRLQELWYQDCSMLSIEVLGADIFAEDASREMPLLSAFAGAWDGPECLAPHTPQQQRPCGHPIPGHVPAQNICSAKRHKQEVASLLSTDPEWFEQGQKRSAFGRISGVFANADLPENSKDVYAKRCKKPKRCVVSGGSTGLRADANASASAAAAVPDAGQPAGAAPAAPATPQQHFVAGAATAAAPAQPAAACIARSVASTAPQSRNLLAGAAAASPRATRTAAGAAPQRVRHRAIAKRRTRATLPDACATGGSCRWCAWLEGGWAEAGLVCPLFQAVRPFEPLLQVVWVVVGWSQGASRHSRSG